MFFTAFILCILRLFKLKTELRPNNIQNLTTKLQHSNLRSPVSAIHVRVLHHIEVVSFFSLWRTLIFDVTFFCWRDFLLSGASFFFWRDFLSAAQLFFAGATFPCWRDFSLVLICRPLLDLLQASKMADSADSDLAKVSSI